MFPRICLLAVLVGLDTMCSLQAQTVFRWGGMGYASAGYSAAPFPGVKNSLSESALLTGDTPSRGWNLGGGGFALLGSRFVLAGHGYALVFPRISEASHAFRYLGGGGHFSLGYAVYNQSQWLVYPAVGIGGMQLDMTIENQSEAALAFGEKIIPAQINAAFTLPTATLDLHFAVRRLLLPGHGPAVDMKIGYTYGLEETQWLNRTTGLLVAGLENAGRLSHFYLKLNIGGGGFFTEPQFTLDQNG